MASRKKVWSEVGELTLPPRHHHIDNPPPRLSTPSSPLPVLASKGIVVAYTLDDALDNTADGGNGAARYVWELHSRHSCSAIGRQH
jgi:hypothetical protein